MFTFKIIEFLNEKFNHNQITLSLEELNSNKAIELKKINQILNYFIQNEIRIKNHFYTLKFKGKYNFSDLILLHDEFFSYIYSINKDYSTSVFINKNDINSYLEKDYKETIQELLDLNVVSIEDASHMILDHYNTFKYLIKEKIKSLSEEVRKECYEIIKNYDYVVFIEHDKNGHYSEPYKIKDFTFIWRTNYGFGWSSYDYVYLKLYDKEIEISLNSYNNNLDIDVKRHSKIFSNKELLSIMNEIYKSSESIKLTYIKRLIFNLMDCKEKEYAFVEVCKNELIHKKEELKTKEKMLSIDSITSEEKNIVNTDIEKIKKRINEIESNSEQINTFKDVASSINGKEKRINLLKIEITYWQNMYKNNNDFLNPVY